MYSQICEAFFTFCCTNLYLTTSSQILFGRKFSSGVVMTSIQFFCSGLKTVGHLMVHSGIPLLPVHALTTCVSCETAFYSASQQDGDHIGNPRCCKSINIADIQTYAYIAKQANRPESPSTYGQRRNPDTMHIKLSRKDTSEVLEVRRRLDLTQTTYCN